MGKAAGKAIGRMNAKIMAERTGLEPATPSVTGRYSNQLNYIGFFLRLKSLHQSQFYQIYLNYTDFLHRLLA